MNKISRKKFLGYWMTMSSILATSCRLNLYKYLKDQYDVIIRDGEIFDGTGSSSYRADIGIIDGVIASIGNLSAKNAAKVYSARHMAVAPGFIDIHSHSDYSLLENGQAHGKIMQGVTTEIIGQDGRSVAPVYNQNTGRRTNFSSYYAQLLNEGISVNVRSHVGAATLRSYTIGSQKKKASPADLKQMQSLYRECQKQGARGISSGLEYLPGAYAELEELGELCKSSGYYTTHMRNEDNSVLYSIEEAVQIAKYADCRLNISHIKAQGKPNWNKLDAMLDQLDTARKKLDFVSCDRYPYTAYHTSIGNLFPLQYRRTSSGKLTELLRDPGHRRSMQNYVLSKIDSLGSYNGVLLNKITGANYRKYSGQRLGDLAQKLGRNPYDLLCDIMIDSNGVGSMVGFGMDEKNLHKLLEYKYCAIASDGAALVASKNPQVHPRNFGTFAEVLGNYVREKGVISLKKAIYKMSYLPARIAQIDYRGKIEPGYFADLVVFDPNQIKSNANYLTPDRYPTGIAHVLVNGTAVITDGYHTGQTPGIIV